MRAKGPKERPTTHSSSTTMCWTAKSAKAAPNMAQVEEVYVTPTLGSVVTASSAYWMLSVWNFVVCHIWSCCA